MMMMLVLSHLPHPFTPSFFTLALVRSFVQLRFTLLNQATYNTHTDIYTHTYTRVCSLSRAHSLSVCVCVQRCVVAFLTFEFDLPFFVSFPLPSLPLSFLIKMKMMDGYVCSLSHTYIIHISLSYLIMMLMRRRKCVCKRLYVYVYTSLSLFVHIHTCKDTHTHTR
jgi:hypothetical protein